MMSRTDADENGTFEQIFDRSGIAVYLRRLPRFKHEKRREIEFVFFDKLTRQRVVLGAEGMSELQRVLSAHFKFSYHKAREKDEREKIVSDQH